MHCQSKLGLQKQITISFGYKLFPFVPAFKLKRRCGALSVTAACTWFPRIMLQMRTATTGNRFPQQRASWNEASSGSLGFSPSQPQRTAFHRTGRYSRTTSTSLHSQFSAVPTVPLCVMHALLELFYIWEPGRTLNWINRKHHVYVCACTLKCACARFPRPANANVVWEGRSQYLPLFQNWAHLL